MRRTLTLALVVGMASSFAAAGGQDQDATSALRRQRIERRTVDAVIVNKAGSEAEHGYKAGDGWFSYELKVDDKPLKIVCTFVGDKAPLALTVDAQKIAGETPAGRNGKSFDVDYFLPEALTRNRKTITVRFESSASTRTGVLLDVRTVWADLQE